MATKKKTKRTPVTKKATKKTAKKKVTKKTSKGEQLEIEGIKGKKKPPLKKDKSFTGVVDVTVSEELAARLRIIRDDLKVDDEAVLMLMVVEAGIESFVRSESQASGNLVDDERDGTDDPYDPEFEDAFQNYTSGR